LTKSEVLPRFPLGFQYFIRIGFTAYLKMETVQ